MNAIEGVEVHILVAYIQTPRGEVILPVVKGMRQ